MKRFLAVFTLMIPLSLVACGGDGSADEDPAGGPAVTDAAGVPTGDGGDDGAQGTGTITIGGTTWEVVGDVACVDYETAMGLQGHAVDDPSIAVVLNANVDEPTAAYATVDGGDAFQWQAGEGFETLGATVPQTEVVDGSGRGTATFVDTLSGPEYVTAEGSWEFSC